MIINYGFWAILHNSLRSAFVRKLATFKVVFGFRKRKYECVYCILIIISLTTKPAPTTHELSIRGIKSSLQSEVTVGIDRWKCLDNIKALSTFEQLQERFDGIGGGS